MALHAAADRERRHTALDDDACQGEVERVLLDVDVVVGLMHGIAGPDWRDVTATGQQNAVGKGHTLGDLVDEILCQRAESTRWVDAPVGR